MLENTSIITKVLWKSPKAWKPNHSYQVEVKLMRWFRHTCGKEPANSMIFPVVIPTDDLLCVGSGLAFHYNEGDNNDDEVLATYLQKLDSAVQKLESLPVDTFNSKTEWKIVVDIQEEVNQEELEKLIEGLFI